jgi:hypothetical protein
MRLPGIRPDRSFRPVRFVSKGRFDNTAKEAINATSD